MRKINYIKSAEMFPLVKEVIESGKSARIMVTGMSMYPFLREGVDSVELSRPSFEKLNRGDIVLIVRDCGQYVMHRVLKKQKNCFYMVGDAQQWIEGPLSQEHLFALVTAVWRKDKRIKCTNLWWRVLSKIWLDFLPFRHSIIKLYTKLHNILPKRIIRKMRN